MKIRNVTSHVKMDETEEQARWLYGQVAEADFNDELSLSHRALARAMLTMYSWEVEGIKLMELANLLMGVKIEPAVYKKALATLVRENVLYSTRGTQGRGRSYGFSFEGKLIEKMTDANTHRKA